MLLVCLFLYILESNCGVFLCLQLTASGDQTARLWDVEKAETLGIFRGHTCSLKSINIRCDSPFVFATGARDGKIMIWDTRCSTKNGYYAPMNIIHGAHVRIDKNSMHVNNRKRKPRRASMLSPVNSRTFCSCFVILLSWFCCSLLPP